MEKTRGNYSQQYESREMNVHLDMEGTNSNGYGEERDENLNMVETIKNLQKDVQRHKDDNERLMRAKEQQDDFNMKLFKSMNIIEKQLEKESDSRKSGSHKPLDEENRSGNVSRHHHHSRKHSKKREGSSTSPSPIRQHKRSGVDEL
jgi:hypothetical protein